MLCVTLACLLALSGQAFAAKIYHPVASPFGALEAAGFSAVAVDNSIGASAGDIYITGPKRTIYEASQKRRHAHQRLREPHRLPQSLPILTFR